MMRNAALAAAAAAITLSFSHGGSNPSSATAFVTSMPNMRTCTRTELATPEGFCASSTQCRPAFGNTALRVSAVPQAPSVEEGETEVQLPELGSDGLYHIMNKEQHLAFLKAHPDKLIVIKFFAPWCRACKGLEPKFLQIVKDKKYGGLPILWADFSVQHNKDYVKSLGILALPSMHFYAGSDGLIENFPCGPSKVPILKRKLVQVINERVDPKTFLLKQQDAALDCLVEEGEASPCAERPIAATGPETKLQVGDVIVSEEQMEYIRKDIPYFRDLTEEDFDKLMQNAKLVTYEAGDIIMRQGKPGRTFYVIESGEVEISVKAAFEDPLATPGNYLGAVINRLKKNNYFGERSLITGEPRAASIRASEKTRCFAFDVSDIPSSSILSGKGSASSERLAKLDDKYGVDIYNIDFIKEQFKTANVASQSRGSANTPQVIRGVDTDEEIGIDEYFEMEKVEEPIQEIAVNGDDDFVVQLLVKFKLVRHAARCFEYVMQTQPNWGDVGEMRRRSMLVNKLTPAQREEFKDVFKIIDSSGDGYISVLELKRAMESVGDDKSDEELSDMINKANPLVNGNTEITLDEFMGVMAEAEFYNLFKDTFNTLDKHQTGFVKASDLDRILCGMRDLISDDRMSIIDVEEDDILIDYEQFSKMLLGTKL